MTKYYVVFAGRQTGIFTEWEDCHASINSFSRNLYKSHPTLQQAEKAFARYKNGPVVVAHQSRDEDISPSTHSPQSSHGSSSTAWTATRTPCSSPTAAKAPNKVNASINPIHTKLTLREVIAALTTKSPAKTNIYKPKQNAIESKGGQSSIANNPISLKDVITKWKIN